MKINSLFFLAFFIFKINSILAQQFQNMDLNGITGFSQSPYNWQAVPHTDPACLAINPAKATSDICDITGPLAFSGVIGTPYSGNTYVSGLYGFDNSGEYYHEGIMQTVSGFTVGCSYSVNFHQGIDKQSPSNFKDPSGFWNVYLDNTLIGSSAVTISNAPFDSLYFAWEARSINFIATATSHTIKFLPMDDDLNSNYSNYTTDGGLRMAIDSIYLISNGAFLITQNISICSGRFYTLPNGNTVSTAGTYIDTIHTPGNCDSVITTVITLNPIPTINQNKSICPGNSYTLPGGTNVNIAGIYIDTIHSSGNCDSIFNTIITINPTDTIIQNRSICSGSSYTLPGGTSVNTAGTYTDIFQATNGCDSTIITTLSVNTNPVAIVNADTTIPKGNSVSLSASGGSTYNWSPINELSCSNCPNPVATPSQTSIYCVTVTNNGCSDTACVTINVIETACLTPILDNLNVPNAFSPNNDGVNDEFCLQGWSNCLENFIIIIYNRWGEKVFESTNPDYCWDGRHKEVPMDPAVFIYSIRAKFIKLEKIIEKKGTISLVK